MPKSVLTTIKNEFKGYVIEEAKKITKDQKVTYRVDVNKLKQEWKVTLDANGTIINKVID